MFTGLIEEVGQIERVTPGAGEKTFRISARFSNELTLGESVSVNGACLTVTAFAARTFDLFASSETLLRTTLGKLAAGTSVNLERAMRADSRFGGHIVAGHVDAVGSILSFDKAGSAKRLKISHPPELAVLLVEKGSIAIDGVSLTVNTVGEESCEIMVIPHTIEKTNLRFLKPGDEVNLETDLIGKYVYRMLAKSEKGPGSKLDLNFLAEHGYLK